MKAFIAPIYFQTNSISSEKLTGGLLLSSSSENWMAFSKEKITIAQKLSGHDIKNLLDHVLALFENKVAQTNAILEKNLNQLFEIKHTFSEEYFNYLNKYSQGLIQFGKPKPIAIIPNANEFAKLFELYVGEPLYQKAKVSKKNSFHSNLKLKLGAPGLYEKADIDYVIKPGLVKGILKPAQITLITKNGAIEAVQAIDFSNSPSTIVNHIYEFEIVAKHLHKFETEKSLKKGKYKIVINKPDQSTDQEILFNNFFQSAGDTFSIIEPDELGHIIDDIISKPHSKFSEFLNSLT